MKSAAAAAAPKASKAKEQEASKAKEQEEWIALSKKVGYEGATALICNSGGDLLFLLSQDPSTKVVTAELPGGKCIEQDGGYAINTAVREVYEETGVPIHRLDFVRELKTTGGTTGTPSVQYVSRELDGFVATKLEKKFTGTAWSKCFLYPDGKWRIAGGVAIRKYNTFILEQHGRGPQSALARHVVDLTAAATAPAPTDPAEALPPPPPVRLYRAIRKDVRVPKCDHEGVEIVRGADGASVAIVTDMPVFASRPSRYRFWYDNLREHPFGRDSVDAENNAYGFAPFLIVFVYSHMIRAPWLACGLLRCIQLFLELVPERLESMAPAAIPLQKLMLKHFNEIELIVTVLRANTPPGYGQNDERTAETVNKQVSLITFLLGLHSFQSVTNVAQAFGVLDAALRKTNGGAFPTPVEVEWKDAVPLTVFDILNRWILYISGIKITFVAERDEDAPPDANGLRRIAKALCGARPGAHDLEKWFRQMMCTELVRLESHLSHATYLTHCAFCNLSFAKLPGGEGHACKKCALRAYCGKDCQFGDFMYHRKYCDLMAIHHSQLEPAAPEAAARKAAQAFAKAQAKANEEKERERIRIKRREAKKKQRKARKARKRDAEMHAEAAMAGVEVDSGSPSASSSDEDDEDEGEGGGDEWSKSDMGQAVMAMAQRELAGAATDGDKEQMEEIIESLRDMNGSLSRAIEESKRHPIMTTVLPTLISQPPAGTAKKRG